MSHESEHAVKPFGNALGIFLGLLVWWSAAALLVWGIFMLVMTGEAVE